MEGRNGTSPPNPQKDDNVDNTNDPFNPAPTPPEPTSVMPATPAAGEPVAGGSGNGQPPYGGGAQTTQPGPGGGPSKGLIAGLVAAAALIIAGIVFFVAGGSDDKVAIIEDTTTTIVEETTTLPETTTTILEETTTLPETTTTLLETTTTVATTTLPPTTAAPTTQPAPIPVVTVPPAPEATMWDVIANSPDLSEFRDMVESAGLVDLLDGPEPVTIFVPSNQAIINFRAGIGNEALLADLQALVKGHVVSGALSSDDVFAATTLDSLAANVITIDGTAKTVDGASLVVIDVKQGPSVLHVVNKVLAPQA